MITPENADASSGGPDRKPKVLFVSRERFRLPLDGAQKRKWDAVISVVDHRVLAAAAPGTPTRDEHFRLVARTPVLDGPLFYLLLPLRIARQLREFRPDAALVQGIHETVAFLIARRLAGVATKVILDVQGDWREATRLYGSPLRRLLNPLNDALAAPAVRGADAVRTVSTQTTALVRALGVEPAAVFPSYTDAQAFLERPRAPLPERPRALFVGVLERYKAFDTLVAAWRLASPRVPAATLHVVSDGSLRHLLGPDIEWSPRLTAEEVAAAMDDSWVFCLPSRSEGLPRVALEAAARGRAIIGGNRAGIPDVVEDGVNGYLVDPDDAHQLAELLVRVLSDRALAERLGAAARRTGEAWGVTPEQYAAKLDALVRRTLDA
jgi:glycosyltransferase involved in cell wall biosynthesis